MLLVFCGAKLLAEICERLGQPGLVGEILAGVLIGPSVLGWVRPGEILSVLADLGVIFLLFRVGLEVKPAELMRVSGISTVVASAGVIVPFVIGWAILAAWGYPRAESVFVGASMVATSVGITARVLAARGLLDARASRVILAAAVIDDVLGLIVLALVSSLARGRFDLFQVGFTALGACAFVAIVALFGAPLLERLMPHVGSRLRLGEAEFALAVAVLLALALAASYTGVAAIVGAFLAGMALATTATFRVRDLAQGATELLVPFFLAGIGLHVNANCFRDRGTLLLAALVLAAAIVSKVIGCGLGSLTLGRADALCIGVGMIPRGEVGMVVAQMGLTMGVVSPAVYSTVVVMAVATTLVAPPLVTAAYRASSRRSSIQ